MPKQTFESEEVNLFPEERSRKHLRIFVFLFVTDRLATGVDLMPKQTFKSKEINLFPEERSRKHLRKFVFLVVTDRLATGEDLITLVLAKPSDFMSKRTFVSDEVNTLSS